MLQEQEGDITDVKRAVEEGVNGNERGYPSTTVTTSSRSSASISIYMPSYYNLSRIIIPTICTSASFASY